VFKKHSSIETCIQPFPVKLHKMPLAIGLRIKVRSHNLPWLILSHWGSDWGMKGPVSVYWKIARSLQYCHRQHFMAKQFEEFQDFTCDNFKLHDLKPAFCNLEYSRTIACHLSHIDFSVSQPGPYKGFGHRTESQIWTEKLALYTSNNSLL